MTNSRISSGGIELLTNPADVDLLGLVRVKIYTNLPVSPKVSVFDIRGIPGALLLNRYDPAKDDLLLLSEALKDRHLYLANTHVHPTREVDSKLDNPISVREILAGDV
jgi:hypothetical protein